MHDRARDVDGKFVGVPLEVGLHLIDALLAHLLAQAEELQVETVAVDRLTDASQRHRPHEVIQLSELRTMMLRDQLIAQSADRLTVLNVVHLDLCADEHEEQVASDAQARRHSHEVHAIISKIAQNAAKLVLGRLKRLPQLDAHNLSVMLEVQQQRAKLRCGRAIGI